MISEKPILFNTEMVKAILDGRKTQTRRVITDSHGITGDGVKYLTHAMNVSNNNYIIDGNHVRVEDTDGRYVGTGFKCPYGKVGDILYVRETWCMSADSVQYKADYPMHWDAEHTEIQEDVTILPSDFKWKPSIHMPKELSRIKLKITDIRVERVQDIDCNDALAEGTPDIRTIENNYDMRSCFAHLWDSIYGEIKQKDGTTSIAHSWAANPWVWGVTFEAIK